MDFEREFCMMKKVETTHRLTRIIMCLNVAFEINFQMWLAAIYNPFLPCEHTVCKHCADKKPFFNCIWTSKILLSLKIIKLLWMRLTYAYRWWKVTTQQLRVKIWTLNLILNMEKRSSWGGAVFRTWGNWTVLLICFTAAFRIIRRTWLCEI